MWRDANDAVLDMLTVCREALDFASGVEGERLRSDLLRLRAVERSLGSLGEAAKRVPAELRDRYPAVPWRAVAGLRDVLGHDDFGVDLDMVEQVVREELPQLVVALQALCATEGWNS